MNDGTTASQVLGHLDDPDSPREPSAYPDRGQVDEERQRFRQNLGAIYKEAPIGLCYLDTDLRYVYINDWLAAINGLPAEEHLGKTIGEVLPQVAEGVEHQLREVIRTGEPIIDGTVEAETNASPRELRRYRHNYHPVRSADGTILGVNCVVQDITEQERALEEKERIDDVKTALRPALAGDVFISPAINGSVGGARRAARPDTRNLTVRQRDVLRLVAAGRSMKKIAADLQISIKTVEYHKYRLMDLLSVKTTAELIRSEVEHAIFAVGPAADD